MRLLELWILQWQDLCAKLNRDYEGKTNVIVCDYVDSHILMFYKMYAKRLKAYKQIGYEVCGGLQHKTQTANAILTVIIIRKYTKEIC